MLPKLVKAGFTFAINGDVLKVHPADKLTDEQCDYIRTNKSMLREELRKNQTTADNVLPFPITFDSKQSTGFIEALPLFPKACKPRQIKPAVKTRLAEIGEFGRKK